MRCLSKRSVFRSSVLDVAAESSDRCNRVTECECNATNGSCREFLCAQVGARTSVRLVHLDHAFVGVVLLARARLLELIKLRGRTSVSPFHCSTERRFLRTEPLEYQRGSVGQKDDNDAHSSLGLRGLDGRY